MKSRVQRFAERVVIVTGGGRGIGRAEALLFAKEGAHVVVSDVGVDSGVRRSYLVADQIKTTGGSAIALTHDVGTFEGAEATVQSALDSFGQLDVLVNNAGLRARNSIDAFSETEFDSVMNSHLKSTFAMIKYATPIFLSEGSGTILNTGSEAGLGQPFNCAYAAAKEGIAGLTRSVARELGSRGVRCNLIRPRAATQKPQAEMSPEWDEIRQRLGRHQLGSRGDVALDSTPENVAAFAVWLCSDAAASVNGRDFEVAGGEVGVWSDPQLERTAFCPGGWTVDLLDDYALIGVTRGIKNEFG